MKFKPGTGLLFLLIGTSFTSIAVAEPVMSKAQYADYSVQYRCIELKLHDDLEKKEQALIKLDDKFGLHEDNFDAFDELITEYERDEALLESVNLRAKNECK